MDKVDSSLIPHTHQFCRISLIHQWPRNIHTTSDELTLKRLGAYCNALDLHIFRAWSQTQYARPSDVDCRLKQNKKEVTVILILNRNLKIYSKIYFEIN